MTKPVLTFSGIQIISLLLAFFALMVSLAGSHGHLFFSNIGGTIALITTIILSIPLLYLLTQRRKFQNKKLLLSIATLLFILSLTVIYIGLPVLTKQFIIEKNKINKVSIYQDNHLTVNFELEPEMFDRVDIEASISKTSGIEFNKFNMTVYNDKNEIVKPVFQPLAWDSLHSETIQMDSFFEINDYSKMNKFALSGQYPIAHTDSLKINIDFAFTKNGQTISNNKQFGVRIANHLTLEKLIEY